MQSRSLLLRSILERPVLAFALATAAALPSRVALAAVQPAGSGRILMLAGGLLVDAASIGPVLVVLVEAVAWAARRSRRANVIGLASMFLLFLVCLLGQNGAAQFRFERGVVPTLIELREGMGHGDFVTAELPGLVAGRFLALNVVACAIAIAILLRLRRRIGLTGRRAAHALGLACGVALSFALIFASERAHAFYKRMHNPQALASPPAVLIRGLVSGPNAGSPAEIRRLLAAHEASPGEATLGARNMGFDAGAVERMRSGECEHHPLARPLDEENEPAVVSAARDLSREMFRGHDDPPIVFQVSLESMRADDIHALDANAPAEIAPFLNEVYSSAANVAAFRHAHQSGVRTSQALSAMMCGLGALPFNISVSRDFGPLPLRCVTDVLSDAGFGARAFYGHDFVFDDMGTFLQAHHVELYGRSSFAGSRPRGVWSGISDASVYAAALDESAAAPATRAQYNFVLTLSHHAPYAAPDDLAASTATAIDDVCRAHSLGGENCARLKTMRYADDALAHFIARVEASKDAARTIVVVSADHTVHQSSPWTSEERAASITQIPMFVWVPEAVAKRATDREAFAKAWTRFRDIANARPISNSDLPTLLLALTSESAAMRALAPNARWHTLGGQTTSPHYLSITGHGVAHGVDAHSGIFDVTDSGVVERGPEMDGLRVPEDVGHASPENRPAIAFWGSFFRDYLPRCSRR